MLSRLVLYYCPADADDHAAALAVWRGPNRLEEKEVYFLSLILSVKPEFGSLTYLCRHGVVVV